MSSVFKNFKCPKCFRNILFEERQEISFCSNCGIYCDREGQERQYDKILNSNRPLWDSLP